MRLPSPLILASASPRRQLLLRQLGATFLVHPSTVAEDVVPGESPEYLVQRLAFLKANEVRARFDAGVVVGADTIVVLNGAILNKPVDADDARRMLERLSGHTHTVYTGFALVDVASNFCVCDYEATAVTFRTLVPEEIDEYVSGGSPLDKAGAYGIQDDFGAVFISRIDGCYYNVVGLPITRLYQALRAFPGRVNT